MSLTLSDADLQLIADQLFLLKRPEPKQLERPANDAGLAQRLAGIASDPLYQDLGIGVVDFADPSKPKAWLQHGDDPWRTASTAKIAMLLAAVQLRDDVRRVKDLRPNLSRLEFDELFSTIWEKKSSESWIREISGKDNAPRISIIFDFDQQQPDFMGATGDFSIQKLKQLAEVGLDWTDMPTLTFYERLKLAGTWSDNFSATACISDIGVPYMKAVQRRYGLYQTDKKKGMRLLLAGGFEEFDASVQMFRPLPERSERTEVTDFYKGSNVSTQPGSAAALTAYMIALMQNQLAGSAGCDTIRALLADENFGIPDAITSGVKGLRIATPGGSVPLRVTRAHTKVGYLDPKSFRCEFSYLEAWFLAYAVIVMGLRPGAQCNALERGMKLSQDIFRALSN